MTDEKIEIIRSRRRTISLQITREGRTIVRVPLRMPAADISRFIASKTGWIEKHRARMEQRAAEYETQAPFSKEELAALTAQAKNAIPARAAHIAEIMGVSYGKITIRKQVSRWGSCSAKGNLSFNCLLMLCPPEVADYVVIHELCHLRELNHSKRFWALVAQFCPDYAQQRRWLRENGNVLIQRRKAGGIS